MQSFQANVTKINLDNGIVNALDVNKFQNILILTGSINSLKIFNSRIAPLIKTKCHVYSGITANPTETAVYNISNFARDKDIDCIISVGGGAVMDCGRMVSLLLSHGGMLHDYIIGGTIGTYGITPNLIYHITIPTISGTGAEISCTASYNTALGRKTIYSPYLFPHATYIDPALMTGISQKLWTNIGFDCFVHALEAYVSTYASPASDGFALQAMKEYIEVAPKLIQDTDNLDFINKMVVASINALTAVNMSSAGATHAIAETLTSHININFGSALALVCGEVCEQNYEYNKIKYDEVKKLIGSKTGTIKTSVNGLIKKLDVFVPSIAAKLNTNLLNRISVESMNMSMRGNPKMMSTTDIQAILKSIK